MLYDIQTAVPIVVVAVFAGLIYLRFRRQWPAARLFFLCLFVAYLTVVASYVVFPIRTDDEFIRAMRVHGDWMAVNLIPLADFPPVGLSQQFLGNIALGIPFGLGAPFVLGRGGWLIVALGLAFALGIEAIQFLMNAVYGFTYRFVDVNDTILNFAGVVVGLGGFYLLRVLYRTTIGTRDPNSYIDNVLAP